MSEEKQAGCLYVYGLTRGQESLNLPGSGINDNELSLVESGDWVALTHECSSAPYESDDPQTVKHWVSTHNKVLSETKQQTDTILPFTFDTIVQPDPDGSSAKQQLRKWMNENSAVFNELQDNINGCDEYGITIGVSETKWRANIQQNDGTATKRSDRKMDKEAAEEESSGRAYLRREQQKRQQTKQIKEWLRTKRQTHLDQIQPICREVILEGQSDEISKISTEDGIIEVLKCSCLIPEEDISDMGKLLETIKEKQNYFVQFTGPWPPYSFSQLPSLHEEKERRENNMKVEHKHES